MESPNSGRLEFLAWWEIPAMDSPRTWKPRAEHKKHCQKHWDSQKQREKVLDERGVLTFEFSMTASIQSKYEASLTA